MMLDDDSISDSHVLSKPILRTIRCHPKELVFPLDYRPLSMCKWIRGVEKTNVSDSSIIICDQKMAEAIF